MIEKLGSPRHIKDKPALREEQLLLLSPTIVLSGLVNAIRDRRLRVIAAFIDDDEPSGEVEWYDSILEAIEGLIDPASHPQYLAGGEDYYHASRKALNFLRFVGFTTTQLSPRAIEAKAKKTPEESRHSLVHEDDLILDDSRVYTDSTYFEQQLNPISPARQKLAERRIGVIDLQEEDELIAERGYGTRAQQKAIYNFLSTMMTRETRLPGSKEEYEEWIEVEARRIQVESSTY